MKITSIKQQVKNPERVSIFVDGKYEFSLSLDELVKTKIKNGEELNAAELKKLQKISADGKLRSRSLEWLLNRPHSTREFKDYLYRKKAGPELTDSLTNEFISKGYIDDLAYAKWLVELRSHKAKSNRAIISELASKGISREVINQIFTESEGSEDERLRKLIEKKQDNSRYKNDPQKFIKYLTSQGFTYYDVKKMLEK